MPDEFNLTVADTELFRSILTTKESPEVVIPEDTDAVTLKRYCDVLGKAFMHAQDSITRMKPFLGRVFLLYKNHPSLYTDLGYSNYNDWMTNGVQAAYGISRSEAFICVRVAQQLGHADPDRLANLGPTKQNVISKIMRNDNSTTVDMRRNNANDWIAKAETMSSKELENLAVNSGLIDAGDVEPPVSVVIRTDRDGVRDWNSLVKNEEVHSLCGTSDEGAIFKLLVSESGGEWLRQIEEIKNSSKQPTGA